MNASVHFLQPNFTSCEIKREGALIWNTPSSQWNTWRESREALGSTLPQKHPLHCQSAMGCLPTGHHRCPQPHRSQPECASSSVTLPPRFLDLRTGMFKVVDLINWKTRSNHGEKIVSSINGAGRTTQLHAKE